MKAARLGSPPGEGPSERGLLEAAWSAALVRDRSLDDETRRRRGVVHTPPAIARFVVDHLARLVKESGLAGSLAEPHLTFVDPAVGTGIFPAALAESVDGGRRPDVIGFDLDAAALAELDARLSGALALTLLHQNALASLAPHPQLAPDAEGPLLVLGNPPWAGRSASRGVALSDRLIADFDRDADGSRLGEKKIGVLSDDYVRFVRWALELISVRTSGGAFALVTNASFIDGPVHRGMRRVLMERLDRLEVLDLGGSALTSRQAGVRDENLFGVRPAAALVFGVRKPGPSPACRVRFGRLRGSRDEKLAELVHGAPFSEVSPTAPHHALRPAPRAPRWYAEAKSVADWLPFHREGLQTNRDALVVDRDRGALVSRLHAIARGEVRLAGRAHFDPERARRALADELERGPPDIRSVAYRPFDDRYYFASRTLCHRPRPDLMRAVEKSALVLVTSRQDRGARPFHHLVLTRFMPDNCLLSPRSSCRARGFPSHDPEGAPNLGAEVRKELEDRLGRLPPQAEVLSWIAAHLGAPAYTEPLDQVLRTDYPRVPLPASAADWQRRTEAAEQLSRVFCDPVAKEPQSDAEPEWVGHHAVGGAQGARLRSARLLLDKSHRDIV